MFTVDVKQQFNNNNNQVEGGCGGHKKIMLDPSSNLIGDKCYHANADAESVFLIFFLFNQLLQPCMANTAWSDSVIRPVLVSG